MTVSGADYPWGPRGVTSNTFTPDRGESSAERTK